MLWPLPPPPLLFVVLAFEAVPEGFTEEGTAIAPGRPWGEWLRSCLWALEARWRALPSRGALSLTPPLAAAAAAALLAGESVLVEVEKLGRRVLDREGRLSGALPVEAVLPRAVVGPLSSSGESLSSARLAETLRRLPLALLLLLPRLVGWGCGCGCCCPCDGSSGWTAARGTVWVAGLVTLTPNAKADENESDVGIEGLWGVLLPPVVELLLVWFANLRALFCSTVKAAKRASAWLLELVLRWLLLLPWLPWLPSELPVIGWCWCWWLWRLKLFAVRWDRPSRGDLGVCIPSACCRRLLHPMGRPFWSRPAKAALEDEEGCRRREGGKDWLMWGRNAKEEAGVEMDEPAEVGGEGW